MRKHKIWTLLIVLSLLAACKQPQSLTPSVSEVAQIKANGTSIRLFCLTNRNGMTIKVTNFAASLTSVSVPDKKGNFEQVVLGFDSLAYIIHSGFISGYQNRYGDNLKPPTNVYHRMTA